MGGAGRNARARRRRGGGGDPSALCRGDDRRSAGAGGRCGVERAGGAGGDDRAAPRGARGASGAGGRFRQRGQAGRHRRGAGGSRGADRRPPAVGRCRTRAGQPHVFAPQSQPVAARGVRGRHVARRAGHAAAAGGEGQDAALLPPSVPAGRARAAEAPRVREVPRRKGLHGRAGDDRQRRVRLRLRLRRRPAARRPGAGRSDRRRLSRLHGRGLRLLRGSLAAPPRSRAGAGAAPPRQQPERRSLRRARRADRAARLPLRDAGRGPARSRLRPRPTTTSAPGGSPGSTTGK